MTVSGIIHVCFGGFSGRFRWETGNMSVSSERIEKKGLMEIARGVSWKKAVGVARGLRREPRKVSKEFKAV